jgi:hypothetical protein
MTMNATLSRWRDRAGHRGSGASLLLLASLLVPSPADAAGPGNYAASRFDVNATVLGGGSLAVIETIAFEFQSGTFQKVWREIPSSRTDGIEIVEARMDGETFPPGTGPGHIAITGGNRVRIEWQFAPTGPSTHTFEPDIAPAWVVATPHDGSGGSFAAFVGSGATSTSGSGAGGGAAGGGGSGAG